MKLALVVTLVVLAWRGEAFGATLTVAPNGDDANPGTPDKPFATLARARSAVRRLVAEGLKSDVTVLLRAGRYELPETLAFGPEDSGTEQCSVTYAAAPGETVVVSGGRRVMGWKKGDGELWTAEVPGVKEGKWYFHQLWVNGQRAVRARTPNKDAAQPCWQLKGVSLAKDLKSHTYTFAPGQLKEWRNLTDVEAVVFGNWEITRKRFEKVDPATGVAQMLGPHARPHDAIAAGAGRWFFLENAIEFLDQPGEWYLDRQRGLLTYWPRPGEDMTRAEFIAPMLMRLLEVRGTPERPVRNLHFKGVEFTYADWTHPQGGYLGIQACHYVTGSSWDKAQWGRMDAAIRFDYAEGCSVTDGAIARLGGCGIELVTRCRKCTVEGNRIHDISGNGVILGGPKTEEDVPKDCRIANNHVHACGLDYAGAVGIWVGFAQRAVIARNLVHDLPYTGISLGWQWNPAPTPARENLIEWNHVYDVMNRLGDGGCIYTLGFQPGTIIRCNHLHDVHRSPYCQAAPNNGMFIDEGSKGFHFERNVIYRTSAQPVRFNQCQRDWHTWKDNVEGGIAAPVPGKVGSALACDGSSAFVEVPHKPELEPEQLTIEAWIKLDEFPGGNDPRRWIVNKNRNEWEQGHYALIISGSQVGGYLNIGGGKENHFSALSPEGVLKLKEWQHIAMTYDGAELKVYLNGARVASAAIGKRRAPGRMPLAIGRRQDAYSYFKGAIDGVHLYSRALGPDELKARSAAPGSKPPDGLVVSWPFDDLDKLTDAAKEVMEKAGPEPHYRDRLGQGRR